MGETRPMSIARVPILLLALSPGLAAEGGAQSPPQPQQQSPVSRGAIVQLGTELEWTDTRIDVGEGDQLTLTARALAREASRAQAPPAEPDALAAAPTCASAAATPSTAAASARGAGLAHPALARGGWDARAHDGGMVDQAPPLA